MVHLHVKYKIDIRDYFGTDKTINNIGVTDSRIPFQRKRPILFQALNKCQ
jgi:hypothetical protein